MSVFHPTAAEPPTLSSLPMELLLKILLHACTTAHLSAPLLVNSQFTRLQISCHSCVYRNLAGVCSEWRDIVREIFGREVVLANGCGSHERDEEVLALVSHDEKRANAVKSVDASLRRAVCSLAGWPAPSDVTGTAMSSSGEEHGEITSQGVELERWREQCLNRERQRLYRLLAFCQLVDTLDVDLGFYFDLCQSPSLIAPTIRSLTLRNSNALETFALVDRLPLLEDLTLRLALDWFLPPSSPTHLSKATCRLRRFELSTTAFGTTSLPTILGLLDGSLDTLTSLTLRNKRGPPIASKAFFPVAQGLIQTFSRTLEELTIKDLPRAGMGQADSQPSLEYFPSRPTTMPRLRSLHLTGLPLPSPTFFTRTLVIPAPGGLRILTLEDFNALSSQPLVDALLQVPALNELRKLSVAFAREVEMGRREGGVWEVEKEAIEGWCAGKGRLEGRTTGLQAGWRMIKVEGCGSW
ncbi:hypothetical protein JCM11641_000547 [Rhodosporidiobolus odoratus]